MPKVLQPPPALPQTEEPTLRGTASNGISYAIFDAFCKVTASQEEKLAKDTRIIKIYTQSEQKKLLKRLGMAAK